MACVQCGEDQTTHCGFDDCPNPLAFDTASVTDTSAVVVYNRGNNTPLVTIRRDGRIEYGPDYTPDAAAHAFWEALREHNPLRSMVSHLQVLADGCEYHPSYRAKQPKFAPHECRTCTMIWRAREALNRA